MPIILDIETSGSFDGLIKTLGATESQVRKASVRALNKTALWLKGKAVKAMSSESGVQQKHLRKRLQVIRARLNSTKAYLLANTIGIKAVHLGTPKQTASGVKVGKHNIKGAFVAKMPGGHTGVFKRKTKRRLPIKEMMVPLDHKVIIDIADFECARQFQKIFTHELRWAART